jgi:hypothetical protein
MIRIALTLVVALCAAACGGARAHHSGSTRPPAATITAASGTRTLSTGSYCWSTRTGSSQVTGCADGARPAFLPGLPRVRVHLGETVVVRLGFTPTAPVEATVGRDRYRLPAAPVLRLHVRHGGFLMLDPRRGSDDVEYTARMVIAS